MEVVSVIVCRWQFLLRIVERSCKFSCRIWEDVEVKETDNECGRMTRCSRNGSPWRAEILHYDEILKPVAKFCYFGKSMKPEMSLKVEEWAKIVEVLKGVLKIVMAKMMICKRIVVSPVLCGCEAWGVNARRIDVLEIKCLWIITGVRWYDWEISQNMWKPIVFVGDGILEMCNLLGHVERMWKERTFEEFVGLKQRAKMGKSRKGWKYF